MTPQAFRSLHGRAAGTPPQRTLELEPYNLKPKPLHKVFLFTCEDFFPVIRDSIVGKTDNQNQSDYPSLLSRNSGTERLKEKLLLIYYVNYT
jgi:hypothetical protein